MTTSSLALEAININKRFGNNIALDNVSLQLERGSFHALLGENGAGKSTLVKCIMGYYQPDSGELLVQGKQQVISNPKQALAHGIGMVYQHFTLIPNMTVAENLVLSRPTLPKVIYWKQEYHHLTQRLQQMPFDIPLHETVASLAAGEKQKVEIVKQLLLDSQILILDEPTSVLTPIEADEMLGTLKSLTAENGLSVLIITHKFSEVTKYADSVTVLRKGKLVGSHSTKNLSTAQMAEMMVGKETIATPLSRSPVNDTTVSLQLENISAYDDSGTFALNGLSLEVTRGEIFGIAGVSGNGQKQLVEILAGQRPLVSGCITVDKKPYRATRKDMKQFRLHCLPEEPLKNACVATMSVADNIAFNLFDTEPFAYKNFLLIRSRIRRYANEMIKRFSIRTQNEQTPIGKLSGGNVQRTVLARELVDKVNVLIIANPCFGLDFKAVADIRNKIMEVRNNGAAVLLISEDLDEVLALSDRIGVISKGKLVYETLPQHADLTTIGQYMASH